MDKPMKKYIIGTVIILFIIIAAVFVSKLNKPPVSQGRTSISIATSDVLISNIYETYTTFGTLQAVREVEISANDDSRVTRIYFSNGNLVSKGNPILQLDSSDAIADLAQKQADLDLAQRTYDRHEQLYEYGGTTKESLDQLKSEVTSDAILVKNSELALQNLTLKAPFDGQLGAFQVNEHDFVSAGTELVKLVQRSPIKVSYSIPQSLASKVKIEQSVTVTTRSVDGKSFDAAVSYISPRINEATGTIALEATIENNDGILLPGMFAQVVEKFGQNPNALTVPEVAVLADIEGSYVYTVENNKATRVNVVIGDIQDGKMEILSGLEEGQNIISQGQQKVNDGDLVTVTNASDNEDENNGDQDDEKDQSKKDKYKKDRKDD
jgi:membrane fusion protein, multidrug efflux system